MTIESVIYLIVLAIVVFSIATIVWFTLRNGISPMPTGLRVQREVLGLLQALKPDGAIFELGSGWGTLALGIARQCPECRVMGFENSPVPFLVSRILCWIMPSLNLAIERRDFYGVSLASAKIVICYLYPGAMERLRGRFEDELVPGTRVISHTFAVPGWDAENVVEVRDLYRTKIYVYRR